MVKDSKFEASITDNHPIFISQKKIEKRRHINSDTLGSFAVDNISVNSDTQHIFKDFEEGRISTSKEVKSLLHAQYTKVAFEDS